MRRNLLYPTPHPTLPLPTLPHSFSPILPPSPLYPTLFHPYSPPPLPPGASRAEDGSAAGGSHGMETIAMTSLDGGANSGACKVNHNHNHTPSLLKARLITIAITILRPPSSLKALLIHPLNIPAHSPSHILSTHLINTSSHPPPNSPPPHPITPPPSSCR